MVQGLAAAIRASLAGTGHRRGAEPRVRPALHPSQPARPRRRDLEQSGEPGSGPREPRTGLVLTGRMEMEQARIASVPIQRFDRLGLPGGQPAPRSAGAPMPCGGSSVRWQCISSAAASRATAARRASAARPPPTRTGLVQEFLNRSDAHLWAIVSNGRRAEHARTLPLLRIHTPILTYVRTHV